VQKAAANVAKKLTLCRAPRRLLLGLLRLLVLLLVLVLRVALALLGRRAPPAAPRAPARLVQKGGVRLRGHYPAPNGGAPGLLWG